MHITYLMTYSVYRGKIIVSVPPIKIDKINYIKFKAINGNPKET
jgi:hypothetical protein